MLSLPPYIAEWFHEPESLCCVRTQIDGAVSWQPNEAFVRVVGDEPVLSARLEAAQPGISQQVRLAPAAPSNNPSNMKEPSQSRLRAPTTGGRRRPPRLHPSHSTL